MTLWDEAKAAADLAADTFLNQRVQQTVDSAVAPVAAQLKVADDLVDALEKAAAVDFSTIAALRGRVAELEAQLTPPTLTGSSIRGDLAGRTQIDVARVFLDTLPAKWDDNAGIKKAVDLGAKALILSWTNNDAARVRAFQPPPGVTVYGVWRHEAENPTKKNDPAAILAGWTVMGPAIRAAGMIPTVILMRETLEARSGRDWHDWFPAGSVDVFGFDSYNIGNKNGVYASPANQLDPIIAAVKEVGLPWLIGETGAGIFGAPENRAAWAKALRQYATEHGASVLCWWDQGGDLMDYHLDELTAAAWLD